MIAIVLRGLSLAALSFCLFTGCAARRANHVFIISIDGGGPAVLQKAAMPTLDTLVSEGACSWTAQTIKPSLTLPSHTSMLTGVPMETHKMSWNGWVPTNGTVKTPTVFAAAKRDELSTAMFAGKEKFRHLLQPGSLDHFSYDYSNSVVILKSDSGGPDVRKEGSVFTKIVADQAADYIVRFKPNLCFIHLTDPDTVGHQFGWGSSEQLKSLADVDAGLTTILQAIRDAGIQRDSVILISADHGGHGKGHSRGTPEDTTIPWIAWGKGVKPTFTITEPISTCDTAATALWLLRVTPIATMEGKPVLSAFN